MYKINVVLSILVMQFFTNVLVANEVVATEEWIFSELKGKNTFFAAFKNPLDKKPLTEDQRSAIRRVMIDKSSNTNVPMLADPAILDDGISSPSNVTVGLFSESRNEPDMPKGVAMIKYDDATGGGQHQHVVWRTTFVDTYVLISDNVTSVYSVHRNVKHSNGGYLLTYVTIRNTMLGVSRYSMHGSAKRSR